MTKPEKNSDHEESIFESASDIGQDSLQSMMRSYSTWLETTVELQSEAARFIADRVRKDMEMPGRIAACGSPQDIYQEQMDFASTLFTDYTDEGQKIAGILSKAVESEGSSLTIVRP